jgi:hypothetical protein
MIHCEQCGKVTGQGEEGTSWICGDCKIVPTPSEDSDTHNDSKEVRRLQ